MFSGEIHVSNGVIIGVRDYAEDERRRLRLDTEAFLEVSKETDDSELVEPDEAARYFEKIREALEATRPRKQLAGPTRRRNGFG